MGDITGPISTLPGAVHHLPDGEVCDEHPHRKAVVRIQGETDSFGSELWDMCEECAEQYRKDVRSVELSTGRCDWCKSEATDLSNRRDYEEGTRGPVYRVCGACRKREDERLQRELDYY